MKNSIKGLCLCSMVLALACNGKPMVGSEADVTEIKPTSFEEPSTTDSTNLILKAAYLNHAAIEYNARMIKHTEDQDVQELATALLKANFDLDHKLRVFAKNQKIKFPQGANHTASQKIQELDRLEENKRNLYYAEVMVNVTKKNLMMFQMASSTTNPAVMQQFAQIELPNITSQYAAAKHVLSLIQSVQGDVGDRPLKISQDEL